MEAATLRLDRTRLLPVLRLVVDLARAALDQTRAKYDAAEARLKALTEAAFKRADLETQVSDDGVEQLPSDASDEDKDEEREEGEEDQS